MIRLPHQSKDAFGDDPLIGFERLHWTRRSDDSWESETMTDKGGFVCGRGAGGMGCVALDPETYRYVARYDDAFDEVRICAVETLIDGVWESRPFPDLALDPLTVELGGI